MTAVLVLLVLSSFVVGEERLNRRDEVMCSDRDTFMKEQTKIKAAMQGRAGGVMAEDLYTLAGRHGGTAE